MFSPIQKLYVCWLGQESEKKSEAHIFNSPLDLKHLQMVNGTRSYSDKIHLMTVVKGEHHNHESIHDLRHIKDITFVENKAKRPNKTRYHKRQKSFMIFLGNSVQILAFLT